ncbi:MAG: RagB/SusD family nutrient uptake outer membrane protein, partial [Prevotellaceae bacterium]|nr:RagB/SusD family nutrient uptake outer membrane protein [Prevotellaceae bacterium]
MKNIFSRKECFVSVIVLAMLVGGVSFTSCQKQLEENLYGVYDAETYFETVTLTDMAVLGVYEIFSDLLTYGQSAMVFDTDTDIAYVEGINGVGHTARDIGHYNIYASHTWFESAWNLYYQGINRANTIIEGVKAYTYSEEDQTKINALVGEAKFLRALCYFDLIRLFGDVPYKDTPSRSSDNFKLPQTDRDTIYNYIIQDILDAIGVLPWTRDNSERITKGGAMGILARVYLFRGGYALRQNGQKRRPSNYRDYYDQVIYWTREIINSGYHDLNLSYEQVFRNYCEYRIEPKESMFEIPFFNTSGEGKHSGVWGTYNGPIIDQNSSYGRANSFIKTHTVFYDLFEAGDLR